MSARALGAFYVDALLEGHPLWARDAIDEIRTRLQGTPGFLAWLCIENSFDPHAMFHQIAEPQKLCGEVEQCLASGILSSYVPDQAVAKLFVVYLRRKTSDLATVRLDQLDEVVDRDLCYVLKEVQKRLDLVGSAYGLRIVWDLYTADIADDRAVIQGLFSEMSGGKCIVADRPLLDGLDMTPLLGNYP